MTKLTLAAAAVLALLAGCGPDRNGVAYDGQFFNVRSSKVDSQRDVFTVTVRDAAKSIEGARLAAHHEGVSYCVENYGSSDITWRTDPLDEEAQLTLTDGDLTLQGKCPQAQRI
ncbi:MAG: hypothetical protein AAF744_02790 [Pseudomonadota bacterium]